MAAAFEVAKPLDGSRLTVLDSEVIGRRQVVLIDRGEGNFEPRPVKVGARIPGWVQVLDGVTACERVVPQATFLIDAESSIRVTLAVFGQAGEQRGDQEDHSRHGSDPGGGK